jgi:hypothetical protein
MRDWDRKAAAAIIASVKTAAMRFCQETTVTAASLPQETRQLHDCNRKLSVDDFYWESRSCMTAKRNWKLANLPDKRQRMIAIKAS